MPSTAASSTAAWKSAPPEMRMDQLLNRFVIRKQLEENGSTLRPISLAVVEEIDPAPPHRRSVASAAP